MKCGKSTKRTTIKTATRIVERVQDNRIAERVQSFLKSRVRDISVQKQQLKVNGFRYRDEDVSENLSLIHI
eukprot:4361223-Karenia_brevis.AAC.1